MNPEREITCSRRRSTQIALLVTLAVLITFNNQTAYAESSASSAGKKDAKKKPEDPTDKLSFSAGVMLGTLLKVDLKERYIFVKPLERTLARRHFYLDGQTFFTKGKKKFPRKKLEVGSRVAVRYYGADHAFVAEEIFVVEEEFDMPTYSKRRKK